MTPLSIRRPLLAIDLGGTKILACLVTSEGEVIASEYTPTLAQEGTDAVIRRMITSVDNVLNKAGLSSCFVSSLSIAAAGAIDSDQGIVTASPNLPGWNNIPLKEMMEKRTGLKTFLINDANAAALGEHRFGAGKGVDNLIYVTISTGIGSGIIIDGKLYSGASGSAGEVGHMTIDVNGPRCGCGNIGCLEILASGRAVAREAQRLISQGAKTDILKLVDGEVGNITAKTVAVAAERGDAVASAIISKTAEYLGVGMVNIVNIFNPEMIIVGGGLAKIGDVLLRPVRQMVAERAFRLPAEKVRIVPSVLGDNATVLGAAAYPYGLTDSL